MLCVAVENEREIQKSYWIEKTSELNLEAMMLDSEASDLDKQGRPEVYIYIYVSASFCIISFRIPC